MVPLPGTGELATRYCRVLLHVAWGALVDGVGWKLTGRSAAVYRTVLQYNLVERQPAAHVYVSCSLLLLWQPPSKGRPVMHANPGTHT